MLLDGKRIVYIEDDPRNRELVEMTVTSEGGTIWFDPWGSPALAMSKVMACRPIDLILLDLMFPRGFNGFDVFKMLQQHVTLRDIPVVIVSAADPEVEMRKARTLGVAGYIAKPIDALEFPRHLLNVMNGQPVWEA